MPGTIFGSGLPNSPFNRTFFNVTLGDILGEDATGRERKLTLFLVDGMRLDVRSIDDLSEQYLTVQAYRGEETGDDPGVHLIPYTLIYRIELASREADGSKRLGFNWKPQGRGAATKPATRSHRRKRPPKRS